MEIAERGWLLEFRFRRRGAAIGGGGLHYTSIFAILKL
jgi:hypothetical protein